MTGKIANFAGMKSKSFLKHILLATSVVLTTFAVVAQPSWHDRKLHAAIAGRATSADMWEHADTLRSPELYYTNRILLSVGDIWHSRTNIERLGAQVDSLGYVAAEYPAADGKPQPASLPLLAQMIADYYDTTSDDSLVRDMLPRLKREYASLTASGSEFSDEYAAGLYGYERAVARLMRSIRVKGDKEWEKLASRRFDQLKKSSAKRLPIFVAAMPAGDAAKACGDMALPQWVPAGAPPTDSEAANLIFAIDAMTGGQQKNKADELSSLVVGAMSDNYNNAASDVPAGALGALYETAYRCLYPSDAASDARRVATVVCIVRKAEILNTDSQLRLLNRYGVRGTFLVQFDALCDTAYTDLLRGNAPEGSDIGAWWVVTQPMAGAAGLKWNSSMPDDPRASLALSIGYKPAERERLVDEYFKRFKDVFGKYPATVGAPAIDAHTAQYMQRKYGVQAFALGDSDAPSTTPAQLVGGWWQGAYYPSRHNMLMPAQTSGESIRAAAFRIPVRDPVGQYSASSFTLAGMGRMLADFVYSPALGTVQMVLVYPNHDVNEGMLAEQRELIPCLARMAVKGDIMFETLAESARIFKSTNAALTLPASVSATLREDPFSGQTSQGVLLYSSPYYRIALNAEPQRIYVSDIHLFDEKMDEPCLDEPTIARDYSQTTLPLVDGANWSNDSIVAGLMFYTVDSIGRTLPMRFGAPHVARTPTSFSVIVPVLQSSLHPSAVSSMKADKKQHRTLQRLGHADIRRIDGVPVQRTLPGDTANTLQMVINFNSVSVDFTLCPVPGATVTIPSWFAAVEHAPGAEVPFAGAALTFDPAATVSRPAGLIDAVCSDFRYSILSPDATVTDTSTRPRSSSGAIRALTLVPDDNTLTLMFSRQ